jgi:hypothetical protein
MVPSVTLLDLVTLVSKHARSEAEVITTVVYMVNSGLVRLAGTFKGARLDPETVEGDRPHVRGAWANNGANGDDRHPAISGPLRRERGK